MQKQILVVRKPLTVYNYTCHIYFAAELSYLFYTRLIETYLKRFCFKWAFPRSDWLYF